LSILRQEPEKQYEELKKQFEPNKPSYIKERVCVAEMSTQIAEYALKIKQLISSLKQHEQSDFSITQLGSQMFSLAIPEDYRISQLRELTKQYLDIPTISG